MRRTFYFAIFIVSSLLAACGTAPTVESVEDIQTQIAAVVTPVETATSAATATSEPVAEVLTPTETVVLEVPTATPPPATLIAPTAEQLQVAELDLQPIADEQVPVDAPENAPEQSDLVVSANVITPPAVPTATPIVAEDINPTATLETVEVVTAPTAGTPEISGAPAALIQSGNDNLFVGRWDEAELNFQTALDTATTDAEREVAAYGLIQTTVRRRDHLLTINKSDTFLQTYPASGFQDEVTFLLAEAHYAIEGYTRSILLYQEYLTLNPDVIDSYVYEQMSAAQEALGNDEAAAAAKQNAINAPRATSSLVLKQERADLLLSLGFADQAIQIYDEIAASSSSVLTLARMDLFRGRAYSQLDDDATAISYYQHAVDNYPQAYDTYSAMNALLGKGGTVDPIRKALIEYNAGQLSNSISTFQAFIDANPDYSDARPAYYLAQVYLDLGDISNYEAQMRKVIEDYPNDPLYGDTWVELGEFQEGIDYKLAIPTYLAYAEAAPSSARVPEALSYAARLSERLDDLQVAAEIWGRIADQYPASDEASESAFQAGIVHFRQGDLPLAQSRFQQAAGFGQASAEERARAHLWLGKVSNALGDLNGAQASWNTAVATAPGNYYSQRAKELLIGEAPMLPINSNFDFDEATEKPIAEAWLAQQLGIGNDGTLGDWRRTVGTDSRWQRAETLWNLERRTEGAAELRALRGAYKGEALLLYQLSLACRDLGDYYCAIWSARGSLDALNLADTFSAPAFFTQLRFGPYFKDLVLPAAEKWEVDPVLLYALIRQESFFQTAARSSAAAQGLMQVIPPTGDYIAANIGWPNYQESDLNRPYINVEFGAWYFRQQMRAFDGNAYAALAAYNAGPGNSKRWFDISNNDPDLFLEVVRLSEPRRYIRRINEFYDIYSDVFGS